jgi:uncharacterized protein (DUF2384 family)
MSDSRQRINSDRSDSEINSMTKAQLMERLTELLGGSKNALIWLNSPHPVLDSRTPKSYVQEGKLEILEYFIHAIETGQPS